MRPHIPTIRHENRSRHDIHAVTIDWGDGSDLETVAVDPVTRTFSGSHLYSDDGLTTSANDSYMLTVIATDNGELSSPVVPLGLTVNNVRPVATLGVASDGYQGVAGQTRSFAIAASDVSPVDQDAEFTFVINWGDGTATTILGDDLETASHVFTQSGNYTISLTATDKDGGVSLPATQLVTILKAEIQGAALALGGSPSNDSWTLTPQAAANTWQVAGATTGTFTFAGEVQIYAGGGTDTATINGTANADAFVVNGTQVILNGRTFADMTTALEKWSLQGQAADDTFTVQAGAAAVNGGAGNDVLLGPDALSTWSITGTNVGTLSGGTTFTAVEFLTGGAAADTYRFVGPGLLSGKINGGVGPDTLDYSARTVAVTVNLATAAASGTTGITSIETAVGTLLATDVLVGRNVPNTWSITGSAAGELNSGEFGFTGFENLTGGSALDQFLVHNGGSVPGTINGGTSGVGERDQLSYALVTGPVTIDLQAKTQPQVGAFLGIEELLGSAAADELRGANLANTWSLTGTDTGTLGTLRFVGIENLRGGGLTDSFSFVAGGTIQGSIVGGLGIDTVIGPNGPATWLISGSGVGTLNAVPFEEIESLTGGSGVDTFNVGPEGVLAGALNGGTGARNVLSYADWSTAISVNLAIRAATAIGGQVSNFTVVIGGSGGDQLTGNGVSSSVLVGGLGNDGLTGGSGRDVLIGGGGADSLIGAAGDDLLIAGRTSHDQIVEALVAILDEWSTTARPYATRVNNLRGTGSGTRLNGDYFLQNAPTDTLLIDPGTADSLLGGTGQDWFLTDDATDVTDQVTSGVLAEQRDDSTP